MPLQYVSDNNGSTIAVQIPIEDWNILKERYELQQEIPQWHKDIIDQRLANYKENTTVVTSLHDFIKEIEADEEV
jgi:Putative addiction module component